MKNNRLIYIGFFPLKVDISFLIIKCLGIYVLTAILASCFFGYAFLKSYDVFKMGVKKKFTHIKRQKIASLFLKKRVFLFCHNNSKQKVKTNPKRSRMLLIYRWCAQEGPF